MSFNTTSCHYQGWGKGLSLSRRLCFSNGTTVADRAVWLCWSWLEGAVWMAWLQSGWALRSLFCTLLLLISLLLLFIFLTRCFFQQLVLTSACDVSLLCLQFYGAIRGWKKGGGEASEQRVVLESWGEGSTKRGVRFLNHDSKVTYLSERKFMQFYSSSSILSPSLNHRWKMLTKYLQNYKNLGKTALVKTKTSCKVLTGKDKALTKICLFKKIRFFLCQCLLK